MRFYLSDLIPRLTNYSKQLDTNAKLVNQHWILIQDDDSSKVVYLFSDNGSLDVYKNGIELDTGTFRLINNSLQIKLNGIRGLFKIGFFDEYIIALKRDSTNHYAFFVNETRYKGEFNNTQGIFDFLNNKYLKRPPEPIPPKFYKKEYHTNKGTIIVEERYYVDVPQVGYKVLQDGITAKDGKYNVGFLLNIHVKNGIIVRKSMY